MLYFMLKSGQETQVIARVISGSYLGNEATFSPRVWVFPL